MRIVHAPAAKYEKPRVLLIDMDADTIEVLRTGGFNVSVGTFGHPTAVKASDSMFPVDLSSANLPHLDEQEIVVINMSSPASKSKPLPDPGRGVTVFWQEASRVANLMRPV